MNYKHLSIVEREKIAIYRAQGLSICQIAKLLGRNKSTISRELKRNNKDYLPSKAQARYLSCRKKSCQHKKLAAPELFLGESWSPEEIAPRLKLENYSIQISYKTIYRAIYAGMFDTPEQKRSQGNRGKIPITNELETRPVEANKRIRLGDFEIDTIVGKNRKAGLLPVVDRQSQFLLCIKLERLGSKEVRDALIQLLRGQPLHSITSDRGREFQLHGEVTAVFGVDFYFAPPHQPWQRGTNENTNGLLREYFPKGFDFNELSEEQLEAVVEQLNKQPRKCLVYKSPWEVWFSTSLHFV